MCALCGWIIVTKGSEVTANNCKQDKMLPLELHRGRTRNIYQAAMRRRFLGGILCCCCFCCCYCCCCFCCTVISVANVVVAAVYFFFWFSHHSGLQLLGASIEINILKGNSSTGLLCFGSFPALPPCVVLLFLLLWVFAATINAKWTRKWAVRGKKVLKAVGRAETLEVCWKQSAAQNRIEFSNYQFFFRVE